MASKVYMTLGQSHTHRVNCHTIDKDCVVLVDPERIPEIFGRKYAFTYPDLESVNMEYYPRGVIEI